MALGQRAIAVADSSRQPLDIFQAYVDAGSVLKDQGKYKEAIPYYEKGFSSLQDADVYDLGMGISFQELSECYEKTGDFSKSLAAYKRYSAISDSVRSKDNIRKTTELTLNAEFDKKQAVENEEQAKKDAVATERQLVLFVGFALTLIIACVAFYAFLNKQKANRIIRAEKKRSDDLLLNILPAETAEELKNTGSAKAKSFDEVTVMFTDFKNFTKASEKMSAEELVKEINYCYSSFDTIISKYGIEKIKTIGDSYMCAGGLPVKNRTNPADVIKAAIEIRDFIINRQRERAEKGEVPFEMRIGIHTGPIVAGIVGIKKFAYDIWGDTVNIASRMEESGEPGQVNISGDTYALVQNEFRCVFRGKIAAKNKPDMDMYFVEAVLN
jgi:adenylate cyclase